MRFSLKQFAVQSKEAAMETTDYASRKRTTFQEREFIDRLASKCDAVSLLEGYLRGMHNRSNFGEIDAEEVIRYAQRRLVACQRRAARPGVDRECIA